LKASNEKGKGRKRIPLNPPFSKGEIRYPPFLNGEIRFPPLEKGGRGDLKGKNVI